MGDHDGVMAVQVDDMRYKIVVSLEKRMSQYGYHLGQCMVLVSRGPTVFTVS